MSNLRIHDAVLNFQNRHTKHLRRMLYIGGMVAFLVTISLVAKYKSKIIGVVLSSKDYGERMIKQKQIPQIYTKNANFKINSTTSNLNIDAKEIVPIGNGIEIYDISANFLLKKNKYQFFLQSPKGNFDNDEVLTLRDPVRIQDQDTGNATFKEVVYNTKSGDLQGKNPLINKAQNSLISSIKALQMTHNTNSSIIYFAGQVTTESKNITKNELTTSKSDFAQADYTTNTIILTKNASIKHQDYTLKSPHITIELFGENDKAETKDSNIKKMTAKDGVSLSNPKMTIHSRTAEYFGTGDEIHFTESVKIADKGKTVLADKAVYNIKTGQATIIPKNNIKTTNRAKDNSRIIISFD